MNGKMLVIILAIIALPVAGCQLGLGAITRMAHDPQTRMYPSQLLVAEYPPDQWDVQDVRISGRELYVVAARKDGSIRANVTYRCGKPEP